MYENFRVVFTLKAVEEGKVKDDRIAIVQYSVKEQKIIHFTGELRVKFNQVGIFPQFQDFKTSTIPPSLYKQIGYEAKRYIKSQKNYLEVGTYE
ncbi:hypothetical protein Q73_07400 [Bacillus coahuilensis m2-6]|uniref:Uncharacterized protein n=1 Tax=Bacillus coahuilensis p1.1.43 TaxID=1150625 RepID=A0A147K8C3_9BACI|nr:hypothetical protein [Bacillus coahuilensis]KUP06452.1 hypothetical protein Q75_07920 [Bacillus coahuilensis p1.1.43]KUP08174.1 hypothetical protein Q73_07400 [Bacillus coahuilensis m2-6]